MYRIEVCGKRDGKVVETLAVRGSIPAARQSILDHSGTVDLPNNPPYFAPEIMVIEGWIIGEFDYQISLA